MPLQILLIPLLPLAAFVLLGLFGRRLPGPSSGWLATALLAVSTILSAGVAWDYFFVAGMQDGAYPTQVPFSVPWLTFTDEMRIDMGILLDPISVMMIVVVSFISLMVHIYSLSYMKGEARYATYFSYLGLFTFSMLGLVLSSNIFQIYMCWELVGVSSFLLIGYHYDRPSAVAASKKAFIVTRFADLGFLIGILVLSFHANTLDFPTLIERLTDPASPYLPAAAAPAFLGLSALTWGLVLVFAGGAGKSAMFPLHIWLPDAMEGPTPVSALIHAATMVVAGVYLVARLFPVFALSCPAALEVVAVTGILSAALAAVIACTQTDIKRVLAYSTMSQIGYMMFALGVAGWGAANEGFSASMFHLFTHAMFKAGLFLCAGVIIHHVHSNDLAGMGGLRKALPFTHIVFLVCCLAIAGIPPFAGFFSKEAILLAAWHKSTVIYSIGLVTSGLTAFYMFRLYFSIFHHKPVVPGTGHGEGGPAMMLPLAILLAGAVFAGFVPFSEFVTADGTPSPTELHLGFSVAPVGLGIAGILLARRLYQTANPLPGRIAERWQGLYRTAYRKFYVDELYLFFTHKIIFNLIGRPAAWIDRVIVDGFMNLLGQASLTVSDGISGMQSGKVQSYAAWFLAGLLGFAILTLYILFT